CTDRLVDLVEEGFDLAIRAGRLADSALVARRLGGIRRLVVASPGYLRRHSAPASAADLEAHSCILFAVGQEGRSWRLESGGRSAEVRVGVRLCVNDYEMIREAARAGLGVALIPDYLCEEDLRAGRLRRLLRGWSSP